MWKEMLKNKEKDIIFIQIIAKTVLWLVYNCINNVAQYSDFNGKRKEPKSEFWHVVLICL